MFDKLRKCLQVFGIYIEEVEETEFEKDLENFSKIQADKPSDIIKAWEVKQEGLKLDQGKLRYTLLPFKAITEVVKVLEFGAKKYKKDNWQKVDNARERYLDAAFRHLISYVEGEVMDSESKLPHLAHAVCCLLFVLWFDVTRKEEK